MSFRSRLDPFLSRVGPLRDRVEGAARILTSRAPLEEAATTSRWWGVRRSYTSGVAKGLTPDRIASMLRDAELGYPARMCELLEEIEDRDLHVVSVLGTRKRAVSNLAWAVKAVGDTPANVQVAEWVTAKLQEIDNLEDGFLDLLDAISKGYAVVELDWYQRAGDVGIQQMKYCPARWFRPDPDDLSQWRMLDASAPTEGVALPPWRFAVHTARAKSGFPVQAGIGRAITWWYLFKNIAVKDWNTYGELYGSPLRVGRYPSGTKPADRDALKQALDQLGVDASAVIPTDMQIEFVGDKNSKAGPDVYERMVALCNAEISKGVLGQTLTTEAGKNGTQALGTVHNDVRRDLTIADAKQLARTIRRCVVTPLILFRFGPNVPVPGFEFDTEPPEDEKARGETQATRAKVFAAAVALGVPVAVAQVQMELQIRAVAGGEATLALPTPATPVAARLPPGGVPTWVALADRPPADVPAILLQVETEADRYLADGGAEAWSALVVRIQEQLRTAATAEEVPALLIEIVKGLNLEPFAVALASATLTAELLGAAQIVAGDQPIADVPRIPPVEAIAYWTDKTAMTPRAFGALAAEHRSRAFTIAGFTTLYAVEEVRSALGQVITDGGTFHDFLGAMDGVFERAGLAPGKTWHLGTVFHNAVSTAYAVGRDREQRRPDQVRIRPYWRYGAILDDRTRPEHRALAGLVYRYDHPFWQVWSPPNGHRCRCWRTAHTLAEVQANGWTVEHALPADPVSGTPILPDPGFQRDPARQAHEFDFTAFPPAWVEALHLPAG